LDERTSKIRDLVRSLPPLSQRVVLRSPRGESDREYHGALLHDYAAAAGLMGDGALAGGYACHYYVVTAEDGTSATLSYAEVAPRFADKQVMLATAQDGEDLRVGVRLIVPGDGLGGRSLAGIVDVRLRSVDSQSGAERPQPGAIEIRGMVDSTLTITADDLNQMTQQTVDTLEAPRHGGQMVAGRRYRGVRLYELLERAGIILDPAINEDFLRRVIVARSTDGYAAVIAGGEIEPRFMNGDVLVGVEGEDEDQGRFRLVIPFDRAVGRSVKRLASLEVIDG
jgi:hypothetical protein